MSDKRKNKRYSLALDAFVVSGDKEFSCRIIDLSISGAKLQFDSKFDFLETIFELKFNLNDVMIVVPVIIRWSDYEKVGVQYITGLSAASTYTILEYIKNIEKSE